MSHPFHDNGERSKVVRAHAMATGLSFGAAGMEAYVAVKNGDVVLAADAFHNLGDAGGYMANWVASWRRQRGHENGNTGLRRFAASVVCLGALVVCGKAVTEFDDTHEAGVEDVAVAVVAGAVNYGIKRTLESHSDVDAESHDSHKHAQIDARTPVVVIGGVLATSLGAHVVVEPAVAAGVSAYTIWHYNPVTGIHHDHDH